MWQMIRKISALIAMAFIGLFATTGVAAADPYPPPVVVNVTVNINIIIVNNGVIFSGGGFDVNETINITITYVGPSGLRSTAALAALATPSSLTTTADADGAFAVPITFDRIGTFNLRASGATSGRTASLDIKVLSAGSTIPAVTPAAAVDSSGLAYTGSSIAGPLTVGAASLIVGLGLLFFGTRLVIRRKHGTSAQ
jgi:hypothetical protein